MTSHSRPKSALRRSVRSISKLISRATDMSDLRYGPAEIASLAMALLLRRKRHETNLVGYRVKYMDAASFRIAVYGIFVEGEYFLEATHDSPYILDCGANIGMATLFFKYLYPKARIRSFEADPATSDVLRLNVEQNHLHDVTVSTLLLADHSGTEKFYVSSDAEGSLMMSATPSRLAEKGREITVQAGKLSDYIDGPVDLLKLDIEGSELVVMRELVASGKIAQISKMIIEYHHKMGNEPSHLATFLAILEEAKFEYQISAKFDRITREDEFQDILIGTYRL